MPLDLASQRGDARQEFGKSATDCRRLATDENRCLPSYRAPAERVHRAVELSIQEAAALLGKSPRTVRHMLQTGRLVGNKRRDAMLACAEWLRSQRRLVVERGLLPVRCAQTHRFFGCIVSRSERRVATPTLRRFAGRARHAARVDCSVADEERRISELEANVGALLM